MTRRKRVDCYLENSNRWVSSKCVLRESKWLRYKNLALRKSPAFFSPTFRATVLSRQRNVDSHPDERCFMI